MTEARGPAPPRVRVRARIHGRVQGVWFRGATAEEARRQGVDGWVRNCAGGAVEAVFEGRPEAVAALVAFVRKGPPAARVERVELGEESPAGERGFAIRRGDDPPRGLLRRKEVGARGRPGVSMPRTAMLFAPPQPPLPLPAEGTVVIGRSKAADLTLTDPDTSRRHAKIVCGGGSYVVHDLLSTNGTWINGARVEEEQKLEPGDRIQVGSTDITFCQVDADPGLVAEPGEEAQTLFVERSTSGETFRGDLGEIPTFAVLQILEMGRKTGALVIDSDGACGRLWLQRGDPVHAQTKGQVGFDAAVALVNAQAGRFHFEPDPEPPARTIEATVTQLLLEASRMLDEGLTS